MALFESKGVPKSKLIDRFIVPPVSILDTRQDYWLQRKRMWLEKMSSLSESRFGDYGYTDGFRTNSIYHSINNGTSNFDPVLAEVMYRWFCLDNFKVLDPFGGEQTKGIVAGSLGLRYYGMEFRQEQVDIDMKNAKKLGLKNVKYICGDSNNIKKVIKDRDFDFLITSPPYYDLEKYSENDSSADDSYEKFMQGYKNIFSQCIDMLKEDSFIVVKVGDIRIPKYQKGKGSRGGKREYRGFVADNVKMFQDLGVAFYNELILLNSLGTAPFRANEYMRTRKIVKCHQNILVFYKGDLENIKDKFGIIEE